MRSMASCIEKGERHESSLCSDLDLLREQSHFVGATGPVGVWRHDRPLAAESEMTRAEKQRRRGR
jgi:hypothetical protein